MGLVNGSIGKSLFTYLTKVFIEYADFDTIVALVNVKKETRYVKAAIKEQNNAKINFGLHRLSQLDGGLNIIKDIYKDSQDETIKKRLIKYLK